MINTRNKKTKRFFVFNPEHDISLAYDKDVLTPPHAARLLRADLDFIPAFFAEDGDVVIVNDADKASEHYEHVCGITETQKKNIFFLTTDDVDWKDVFFEQLVPWGMDRTIYSEFARLGMKTEQQDENKLKAIRKISSREWTVSNLQGKSVFVENIDDLKKYVDEKRRCVIKSPWSSTGRGVRYVNIDSAAQGELAQTERWAINVLKQQGGIVAEPQFNKIVDFGMEFRSTENGIEYTGLSLFNTVKGAYTGNVLADEVYKSLLLSKFVSVEKQEELSSLVISALEKTLRGLYEGPFGVDFMVTSSDEGEFKIEIAELNLRYTMGHLALAISPDDNRPPKLMRISFDGSHYHLLVSGMPVDMSSKNDL